jgi:hypothetical protein
LKIIFQRAIDLCLLAIYLLLLAFVKFWKRDAALMVMTDNDKRSVADPWCLESSRMITGVTSRDFLNAGVVLRLVGAWSGVQRLLKRNRQTD